MTKIRAFFGCITSDNEAINRIEPQCYMLVTEPVAFQSLEVKKYLNGSMNKVIKDFFDQYGLVNEEYKVFATLEELFKEDSIRSYTGLSNDGAYILRFGVEKKEIWQHILNGSFNTTILDAQNYNKILSAYKRNEKIPVKEINKEFLPKTKKEMSKISNSGPRN